MSGNRVYGPASFPFTDPQSPFFAVVWANSNIQMDDDEAFYSAINTTISPPINTTSLFMANGTSDRSSVSTAKNSIFFLPSFHAIKEKSPNVKAVLST